MTLKSKFGTSQSVTRIEDKRLLKGEGRYVDDICPKDAYFVSFLRSPIAHGKIIEVDNQNMVNNKNFHITGAGDTYTAALINEFIINKLIDNKSISKAHRIASKFCAGNIKI